MWIRILHFTSVFDRRLAKANVTFVECSPFEKRSEFRNEDSCYTMSILWNIQQAIFDFGMPVFCPCFRSPIEKSARMWKQDEPNPTISANPKPFIPLILRDESPWQANWCSFSDTFFWIEEEWCFWGSKKTPLKPIGAGCKFFATKCVLFLLCKKLHFIFELLSIREVNFLFSINN